MSDKSKKKCLDDLIMVDTSRQRSASPCRRFCPAEDGPVFAEPWQAQAFALAVRLSAEGRCTWTEWTRALGDPLQASADRGEPDDGSRYFEYWLAALEHLVVEKKLTDRSALSERKEAWADAYRRTLHGQPVELRTAVR